jgi:signal transduction histidine kinase
MAKRIFALVGGHLVAAALLCALAIRNGLRFGPLWQVCAFAAALALVGLFPLVVELGRSACAVLLVDAVIVVALFCLPPLGVALAATIGELIACSVLRLSPLKVSHSAAATLAATLAGALTFVQLGGSGRHGGDPRAWLAALGAMTVFLMYNYTATTLVRSVVERKRVTQVAAAGLGVFAATSLLSATMGVIVVSLYSLRPAAVLLVIPFVVAAALMARGAAAQRAAHLRFERLYEASSRTTGLDTLEQALAHSASEARGLVTGGSAVCCVPTAGGEWTGMLVDDRGARPADAELVAVVVALVGRDGPREVTTSSVAPSMRRVLPPGTTVVTAGQVEDERSVALAVFREMAPDHQGDARGKVLAAFVGHAALTAENAKLYAGMQGAFAHQVDLNRQKDELAAAVSHELRTPLASMIASVATLRRLRLKGRLSEASAEQVLDVAERQGERLRRLIDDLLMIASIEQSPALVASEPVDVAELATEVAADLSRLAPNHLSASVHDDVGTVSTSAARLRQILFNLVENGIKYADGSDLEVVACRELDQVKVSVIDHGPGIAAEDAGRIFERFVQLDQSATRTRGGTGLGLFLCRRIAEALGGTVAFTPTPGGGATFTLSFAAPRLVPLPVPGPDRDAGLLAGVAQKGSQP